MLNRNFCTGTFCTRISPGCRNCYASVINKRFGTGAEYTVPNLADHEFYIDEKILAEPLKRKKPATIFFGDMYDGWHESIPEALIDRVMAVVALSPWHVYQGLTKRAQRMYDYFSNPATPYRIQQQVDSGLANAMWPIPNLWLGVSVEDQPRADQRIELLQRTPAAIRFLSVEPQLEEIWIENHLMGQTSCGHPTWVICGGESGPGARPFNLAWAESLLDQCRAAGVPFFMKQIGSNPVAHEWRFSQGVRDRKGGDLTEWPAHLRVREFPA